MRQQRSDLLASERERPTIAVVQANQASMTGI